jgi:hypothetical protein
MGTDIHVDVEVLRLAPAYVPKPADYETTIDLTERADGVYAEHGDSLEPMTRRWVGLDRPADAPFGEWYGDRNYGLFAILAGVRGATISQRHGVPVKLLDDPRGLPADLSPELRPFHSYAELHSSTWFTLRELMSVDWHGPDFAPWRDYLHPESEWFVFLDRLKGLTRDDGSDVRIVCWFDN